MEEDCELNLKDLVATFSGIYKIYIFALRLILTLTPPPPPWMGCYSIAGNLW